MKIGLLSYRSNPYSGGQGIYLKHLSLALLNLGHEVDVLSGPPYPDLHKDINTLYLCSPSWNRFTLVQAKSKKWLYGLGIASMGDKTF